MDTPDEKSGSVTVIHALEPFPEEVTKTIFLAGPTPRGEEGKSWRPNMVELLVRYGFDGHVFVPEPKNSTWAEEYSNQVEWEEEGLQRADCILFWVPRDIEGKHGQKMPALTTNDEWGAWKASGKVVWGDPPYAEKTRYQKHYAKKFGVPMEMYLNMIAQAAVKQVGEGALRKGGECQVPLHIWRKPDFQAWYKALKEAGNRLDGARLVWNFRVPAPDFNDSGKPPARTFLYALHVNVHIGAEDRNKRNEIVIFRPDISSVVLYHRPPPSYDRLQATKVVLVKEFRSPVRNGKGFVYELPGGSSPKADESPEQVAAQEVEEEVGLKLEPDRLHRVGQRQIGATLAAHHGAVYAVELTRDELTLLEEQAAQGVTHGEEGSTERCYTVVEPVGRIMREELVDWSQLGMILSALIYTPERP